MRYDAFSGHVRMADIKGTCFLARFGCPVFWHDSECEASASKLSTVLVLTARPFRQGIRCSGACWKSATHRALDDAGMNLAVYARYVHNTTSRLSAMSSRLPAAYSNGTDCDADLLTPPSR